MLKEVFDLPNTIARAELYHLQRHLGLGPDA